MSDCVGYGKAFAPEFEDCVECAKKSKAQYNKCKMLVFESLNDPKYPDNNEIVRMTLTDEDWLYYCKKIIKKTPHVVSKFGEFLTGPKRGRKSKKQKMDADAILVSDVFGSAKKSKKPTSTMTDRNLSEYFTKD